ncbi:hypothetical protein [Rathayibacter sp. VKM Ac-2760]|uniref:hypothetical protein n=1 Tax=Rathayibacter sp. VKM Ac-2760 TaxID=2609253 RepID=UPI001316A48A|nr:hypothetical protein [Rathayibacter sp. VKM Ac-2760]QHC59568.1 hypothetical protein GSU72_14145 [Rathayibacter sp. VKM Ac-2760]
MGVGSIGESGIEDGGQPPAGGAADHGDDPRRARPDGPPPFPLSLVVVVPIGMLVTGWLLATPLVLSAPWVLVLLTRAGLPYAVLALAVAAVLRLRAARELRASGLPDEPIDAIIASGRSLAQRAARASAFALLGLWVVVAVPFVLQIEPGLLAVVGGPVIAGAVLSIVADARLLFSPRIARAEVAAVLGRGDGRRRILANWIAAPLSWFAFAIPAQFLGVLGGI